MKLRNKLSLTFAMVVLFTVALLALLSNLFINSEFKKYIAAQQEQSARDIVALIGAQYGGAGSWDLGMVNSIGLKAMEAGFIVTVYDNEQNILWDAIQCDMAGCMKVINNIEARMRQQYPHMKGEFTSRDYTIMRQGVAVGTAKISYYGPYFLSDNDSNFLRSLNTVSFSVGLTCLILSIAVGLYMSKRISEPISKAASAARRMSNGDYTEHIEAENDTAELTELVDSVNHLSKVLSYQESLRKQLTADVSHELRTPVTSMQTHLEAMLDGIWEPTRERLESCYEEAARIGSLVKDLEALARIEADGFSLNKDWISLKKLWSKTINIFELELEDKNLSVTLDGDAREIFADEERIQQVAVNLLSNAIKYTPDGGIINITLTETKYHVLFSVADDGIGIPGNEIPFIFERFYRAEKSRNRKMGGAGIGLAIVKSIVLAHGGEVKADSFPDKGSVFTVTLPNG